MLPWGSLNRDSPFPKYALKSYPRTPQTGLETKGTQDSVQLALGASLPFQTQLFLWASFKTSLAANNSATASTKFFERHSHYPRPNRQNKNTPMTSSITLRVKKTALLFSSEDESQIDIPESLVWPSARDSLPSYVYLTPEGCTEMYINQTVAFWWGCVWLKTLAVPCSVLLIQTQIAQIITLLSKWENYEKFHSEHFHIFEFLD